MVGSDGITITLTPNTVDVESQAGTISVPTGTYSEISATIPLIIPNMAVLYASSQAWLPRARQAPKSRSVRVNAPPSLASLSLSTTLVTRTVRTTCLFRTALIQNGGEFTIGSTSDPVTIELNVTMLPDEKGYVNFGCSDPSKRTKYDPEQQKYVDVVNG